MSLLLTGPVLKALHRTVPVSRRHRERVGERKDCLRREEKDITFWSLGLVGVASGGGRINGGDQKYPKITCSEMDARAELLAHLNSLDSHLFEYSELEEWYENREREISLKVRELLGHWNRVHIYLFSLFYILDGTIIVIIIYFSLQLLVNELMKEGKINMRTVTSGDESCDLYWFCHPQEKKVTCYKVIC